MEINTVCISSYEYAKLVVQNTKLEIEVCEKRNQIYELESELSLAKIMQAVIYIEDHTYADIKSNGEPYYPKLEDYHIKSFGRLGGDEDILIEQHKVLLERNIKKWRKEHQDGK